MLAASAQALCSDGQTIPLTESLRKEILARAFQFGDEQTLRVMALAVRNMPGQTKHVTVDMEKNLTFLGLVGMLDPPREEVSPIPLYCTSLYCYILPHVA